MHNVSGKMQGSDFLTAEEVKERLNYFGNLTIYYNDKKVKFVKNAAKIRT